MKILQKTILKSTETTSNMLSTIILAPVLTTTSSSLSSSPEEIVKYFSSSSSLQTISVNDILTAKIKTQDDRKYQVIETSPIIRNGKIDPSTTQWIVLDQNNTKQQEKNLLTEKLQRLYQNSLKEEENTIVSDDEEDEEESTTSSSMFLLGDYIVDPSNQQTRKITLVNLATITTLVSSVLSSSLLKRKLGAT